MHIGIQNTRNTWRLSWFRYKTFIYLFEFKFSTRGKGDTISYYADCSFIVSSQLTDSTNAQASCRPLVWPRPDQKSTTFLCVESQLTAFFFQILKSSAHRFQAWCHSHPQSYFLSGVFIVTSVIVTSSPRANTCTQCVHLTNPCTKPKSSQPN